MYRTFKEEGGVRDVCRATRRTYSTAVIDIVKTFDLDNKEVLFPVSPCFTFLEFHITAAAKCRASQKKNI